MDQSPSSPRSPGEPRPFSGFRSLVVQAGRNHAAVALQAFPLPFPGGMFFAAECLGNRSNKFTASLMSNLLSGALPKQRAELTRLNQHECCDRFQPVGKSPILEVQALACHSPAHAGDERPRESTQSH